MKAIFLAAGKGVRMQPFTYNVPKPLLKIAGKTLLEHNIDKLPEEVDEIIIVVGYLKEQIINYFGELFNNRKINYVEQKKALGTGHAVSLCSRYVNDDFLVLMADDLYSAEDILNISRRKNSALLVKTVRSKFRGGKIVIDTKNDRLLEIKEGVHKSGLINAALYKLTPEFFDYPLAQIQGSKEYGLPQQLVLYARDHQVDTIQTRTWSQISDLKDAIKAEKVLFKSLKTCKNKSALDSFFRT